MKADIQKIFRYKSWTVSVFLVPLILTFSFGLYLNAIIISSVIVVSFLYHWEDEKKYKSIDKILAWALIFSNFVLCYSGNFKQPYFAITLILVLFALYFLWYRQKKYVYDSNHGIWHIASSLITIFSILTYIT